MPSYVVKLPAQIDGKAIDWSGARFHDLSVWGTGNGGKFGPSPQTYHSACREMPLDHGPNR